MASRLKTQSDPHGEEFVPEQALASMSEERDQEQRERPDQQEVIGDLPEPAEEARKLLDQVGEVTIGCRWVRERVPTGPRRARTASTRSTRSVGRRARGASLAEEKTRIPIRRARASNRATVSPAWSAGPASPFPAPDCPMSRSTSLAILRRSGAGRLGAPLAMMEMMPPCQIPKPDPRLLRGRQLRDVGTGPPDRRAVPGCQR